MRILLQNLQNNCPVHFAADEIKRCLNLAYQESEASKNAAYTANVSLLFVTAEKIKALNASERHIEEVTDVLSFPLLEMEDGRFTAPLQPADLHPGFTPEAGPEEVSDMSSDAPMILELGDIVICAEQAKAQAEAYGHSLLREYCFLAVHGLLHLLGWDHERGEEAEKEMFALQDKILDEAGISRDTDAYPPQEEEEEGEEEQKDYSRFSFTDTPLPEDFRSGFVAIVGRPNAGKSTLLNRLIGNELAIVTRKAQTTRHNIRTVLDDGEAQIIFVDTPGIHRSKNKLDRYMADSAWYALHDADLGLLLADPAKKRISEVEKTCCRKAEELGIPLFLLLTKADAQPKEELLPLIEKYSNFYAFDEIIPISAKEDENIDLLLELIKKYLPRGPRYYAPDAYTDQTERGLAAEYIREQLLHYTHQEVPHHSAVCINEFKESYDEAGERDLVRIRAEIIVNKESHKGIVIGKGGQSIKRIGTAARIKLEELLGCKVYLDLHVKVRQDWQSNEAVLKSLGYVKGKAGPSAEDIL